MIILKTSMSLYENEGWSLFLGTDYSTCTILHLAENRASWPSKVIFTEEYKSSDGKVIPFHDVVYQDEDFNQIGHACCFLFQVYDRTLDSANLVALHIV